MDPMPPVQVYTYINSKQSSPGCCGKRVRRCESEGDCTHPMPCSRSMGLGIGWEGILGGGSPGSPSRVTDPVLSCIKICLQQAEEGDVTNYV